MNPDVTITISTGGDSAISTGGPRPSPTDEAIAEGAAGPPRGPIPIPLDQLPPAVAGEGAGAMAGAGGRPVPAALESLTAESAKAGGSAPMPMDLDQLMAATARRPSPKGRTTTRGTKGTSKRGTPRIPSVARAPSVRKAK